MSDNHLTINCNRLEEVRADRGPGEIRKDRSKQTAAPSVVYWDMPNPGAGAPGEFIISRPGDGGGMGGACALGELTRVTEK